MDSRINIIIQRFIDESDDIFNYVKYSEDTFHRNYRGIAQGVNESEEIQTLLQSYEFEIMTIQEEKNNQKIIETLMDYIKDQIEITNQFLYDHKHAEIPKDLESNPINSDDYALVDYFSPESLEKTFDDYIDYMSRITPREMKEEIDADKSGYEYYGHFIDKDYNDLKEYCMLFHYNQYRYDKLSEYHRLMDFQTLYSLLNLTNRINIYRQAFILITTAFDAVVTDVMELVISDNFFEFYKNDDDTYKLKDIVKSKSFESFKDEAIRKTLGNHYASGLLGLLYKFDNNFFIINKLNIKSDLDEIIARRNVHIHKRGKVDQDYFDQSKGNIYKLKPGDYAEIGTIYLYHAHNTLLDFLNNIVDILRKDKN